MMKHSENANETKPQYEPGQKRLSLKWFIWAIVAFIVLVEYAIYIWSRIHGLEVEAPNILPLIIGALGGL